MRQLAEAESQKMFHINKFGELHLNSFTAMDADPRPISERHIGLIIFSRENMFLTGTDIKIKISLSATTTFKG